MEEVQVMHRVAVISDTHGLLRPEVMDVLKGCDVILHGGDINRPKILDELNNVAPVYAVRGNNDKEWAEELPKTLDFEFGGIRFFMVHNKKMITPAKDRADVIVYGHSHKYEEKYTDGQLWLNPGSCGPRRFTQPVTMALLEIATGQETDKGEGLYRIGGASNRPEIFLRCKRIDIPHTGAGGNGGVHEDDEKIPPEIKKVIKSVMKATDRGMSVQEISAQTGISQKLAEQICRLYLTHPGVDEDGIMTKMGL